MRFCCAGLAPYHEMDMAIDDLRAIMSGFPETIETISYGTMSFQAGKKGICRLWGQRELDNSNITDTDVLVLVCEEDRAEMLAEAEPGTYFRTPHYHGYDYVLVRLVGSTWRTWKTL
jgi:hypothetical protein